MKKQNILVKGVDNKTDLLNKKSIENEFRIIVQKSTQIKTSFLQFMENTANLINIRQFFNKSNKTQAQLLLSFQNELNIISQNLSKLHQYSTIYQSDQNFITDSTVKGNQFNQTPHNINQIQFQDMYQLNLELTEQNENYEKKLEQAECEIKRLEQCNNIYLKELNSLKLGNGYQIVQYLQDMQVNKNQNYYNDQLEAQNEQLKIDLAEAEDFIAKNNQQFVRELQKYNQKIWKLQKQTQSIRILLHQTQNQLDEQTTLVNKLREQNIQLQILARNLKNLMVQETNDTSTKDCKSHGQLSERPRQNKLREFFKQKIHEGLSKRL